MKKIILALTVVLFTACNVSDSYQKRTHQRLAERQSLLPEFSFDFLDTISNADEREAMMFLYAYMPLSDIADYEPSFFARSTQIALQARRDMSWGKTIPEELFRHFVLPVRVNNEALDTFRTVYYDELAQRVAGLSMDEAALEVNHWCHEHVTYTPSDARTSSPLSTICTALGRCGEESVLAVAAMRTVGIPARQVYTPRWAHTDDNHAWIEVWTGDRWHFMGACEPEPVLDLGWFNASAGRAMLMHTQVVGPYDSALDVISRSRCYTEINVIDGYVPTRRVTVSVVDTLGQPVADAKVEFKIFNYSEFCTVATLPSDNDGHVSITTGLGNILAWASHEGRFGYALIDTTEQVVCLAHAEGDIIDEDIDIVPPADHPIPSTATDEQVAANKVRLAYEDSIRLAYVGSFLSADAARKRGHNDAEVALLSRAAGNTAMLSDYLLSIENADVRRSLVAALRYCSAKDLRDVSVDVLNDYCQTAVPMSNAPEGFTAQYVLSPRVEVEPLRPFRAAVAETDDLPNADSVRANPAVLVDWVRSNIRVLDDENPRHMRISPAGVLRLRVSDIQSRNVFFVALARALGLPARIESVTGRTEYYSDNQWVAVRFDEAEAPAEAVPMGGLALLYEAQPGIENPVYYRHFSIARIEEGVTSLLNFSYGDATELGTTASASGTFTKVGYPLAEGYYMITTGRRMADGRVLAHVSTFNISKDETHEQALILRQPGEHDIQVMGSYDAEAPYLPIGAETPISMLATTGRGYYMLALLRPTDEPGMHATRALQSIAKRMQEWNRPLLVLFPSEEDYAKFDAARLNGLPNVSYGIDIEGKIANMMRSAGHRPSASLPIVVIGDSFGRLIYMSEGYNTSLADQVVHTLTWM